MNTELWAAIIGSLVLVVCSGIGVLFWSHMTAAQQDAGDAHRKAHSLEVQHLEQRTVHSEELRKAERDLLEHKLEVARDYVRRTDHDSVVTEIFRKLENQDRQVANGFTALRSWLDQKFETIGTQIHNKQDRT